MLSRPSVDDLYAVKFIHSYASFLSKTVIHWLSPLLVLGFRRTLCLEDLGKIPQRESTAFNFGKLKEAFVDETKRARRSNRAPSLWRCFWRLTYSQMIVSGIFKLVSEFIIYVPPLSLDVIISFVETQRSNVSSTPTPQVGVISVWEYFNNGYVVCFIIFIALLIHLMLVQHHNLISILEGIRCKCAIQALVYDKSLRMMTSFVDEGRIMNHMTVDPVRIVTFFNFAHYVWTLPIGIATGFLILYFQLGKSALIGGFVVFLLVPLQYLLAWKLAVLHKRKMELADWRLKISNELLQSIKLLKLYAWERFMQHSVSAARRRELFVMLRAALVRMFSTTCTDGMPFVACLLTFSLYNRLETEPLSATKVFSCLVLFSCIANRLFLVCIVINAAGQARSSIARLQSFLMLPDLGDTTDDSRDIFNEDRPLKQLLRRSVHYDDTVDCREQLAVRITDGIFSWSNSPSALLSANVTVPLGKLTVIIGPVASGKSSLLYAMLGEMQQISGRVHRNSQSVALVPQSCWILNATVRENIVFGHALDQSRYKSVLEAVGLEHDLTIFPSGDQCEIGEKGATLSGGQKQRIAIARALYPDPDVLFLDDCMSALDAVVGAHVFNEAIMKMAIGCGKTVVLVTHHVHLLPKADHLILMRDQSVIYEGSPSALSAEGGQQFASLLEIVHSEEDSRDGKPSVTGSQLSYLSPISESIVSSSLSHGTFMSDKTGSSMELAGSESPEFAVRLVQEEQLASGSVPWSVYLAYAKSATWLVCTATILLFVLSQSLKMTADFFLTEVVDRGREIKSREVLNDTTQTEASWDRYEDSLMIYIRLSVTCVAFVLLSTVSLELMVIVASKNLHRKLIESILSARLEFFDRTPVGRILNRLSADMNVVDERLTQSFDSLLFCTCHVVGAVIMNSVFVPYFIIPVIPMFVLFLVVQRFFIASCRELQRLECVTRSPVLAHVSQTLGGLSTIRAFGSQKRFIEECFAKIDANQLPFVFYQTSNIWMGLRLDILGACIVLAASLSSVTSCIVGNLEPSMVGLVIAYAMMISSYLNWMMRGLSDTEIHFNSVERVVEYCELESEGNSFSSEEDVDDRWPTSGEVEFKTVSLTYSSHHAAVVRDVNLHILPGQKVTSCCFVISYNRYIMLILLT